MFEGYQDILTVEEVSEMLVMGRNAVYGLLQGGTLKGYHNGRVWRIPRQAVIEYVTGQAGLKAGHNV